MFAARIAGKIIVRVFVGAFVADPRPRTIAALAALCLCLPRLAAQEIIPGGQARYVGDEAGIFHDARAGAFK